MPDVNGQCRLKDDTINSVAPMMILLKHGGGVTLKQLDVAIHFCQTMSFHVGETNVSDLYLNKNERKNLNFYLQSVFLFVIFVIPNMKSLLNKRSTVHNPVNFEPSDYVVIGYIDNVPPIYNDYQTWQDEFNRLFPDGNAFKCQHCGQGNVRYVVSALHVPTGNHTCFGDICCERLQLPNHEAFRSKIIRSVAAHESKLVALSNTKKKFLADNQLFAEAYASLNAPGKTHNGNSFARDVASQFDSRGDLSPRQVASFISSIARDQTYVADRAAAATESADTTQQPILTGKVQLKGKIVAIKDVFHQQWGASTKMTVLLEDGNKVWGTRPKQLNNCGIGDTISFIAEVSVSNEDSHFGFFSRPSKSKLIISNNEHSA